LNASVSIPDFDTWYLEVAGALARLGEPEDKTRDLVARLTSAPHEVIPLGVARAHRAIDVAISGALRGADAVYVWLATSRGLPLCTLDHEMAERAAAFCKVVLPVTLPCPSYVRASASPRRFGSQACSQRDSCRDSQTGPEGATRIHPGGREPTSAAL